MKLATVGSMTVCARPAQKWCHDDATMDLGSSPSRSRPSIERELDVGYGEGRVSFIIVPIQEVPGGVPERVSSPAKQATERRVL